MSRASKFNPVVDNGGRKNSAPVEPPILNVIFDKPKFIQILRRNRIAQAVSYSIAFRSSKWNSTQEAQKEPDYDKADIDKRLNIILSEELNWMMFFQIHEIDQYTIYYEDLVADSASVCQGLAEYLGVDTDFDFDIAGAEFKKVSGRKNSDWENRYRAEASLLRI